DKQKSRVDNSPHSHANGQTVRAARCGRPFHLASVEINFALTSLLTETSVSARPAFFTVTCWRTYEKVFVCSNGDSNLRAWFCDLSVRAATEHYANRLHRKASGLRSRSFPASIRSSGGMPSDFSSRRQCRCHRLFDQAELGRLHKRHSVG